MGTREVNFDGLVGPTHNYAGLAEGNLAAAENRARTSNPRAAARQGLDKMRLLVELGLVQGVLPPQERPRVRALRALGFAGGDRAVIEAAGREAPHLLAGASSASSMWAANAATVTPSVDASDGRLHLTPANLQHHFHRSLEAAATERALRAVFWDETRFVVHSPLPAVPAFGDEGAANHTRLAAGHGAPGLHLFTFGRAAFDREAPAPSRFPARQTREASEAVARRHGLPPEATVWVQQNPSVVDQGVFHNDVIAVGNEDVLLVHEAAYLGGAAVFVSLRERFRARSGGAELRVVRVPEAEVGVDEAIRTYLFNTQLLTLPGGEGTLLLAPAECQESDSVRRLLDRYVEDPEHPIDRVRYVDVRESMRNGGGPACLRLRVTMTDAELGAANQGVLLTPDRLDGLEAWVDRHYRDRLAPADLMDPELLDEGRRALDELTGLLELGSLYEFQREGTGL
ncbi:MAG TPA: N-succinylarginine dihydrolase [Polyangiaceae bacterium LLY-WYZ-14_1]|nr:N-succinylarginine dihydrolase [Polyangiaceae bacterium LLY-WYZ-14_1]